MKLATQEELCSGCSVCRVVCTLENFKAVQPARALLKIRGEFPDPGVYKIQYCTQCGVCAGACPEEAIVDHNGIYLVDKNRCTQCMICLESCPFEVMITDDAGYPAKCTGCGKCAELCPREAILEAEA